MNYLNTMLERTSLNDEDKQAIEDMIKDVNKRLIEKNIAFNDDALMVFMNHICALGKRILKQEFIDIDPSLLVGVSSTASNIAAYLVEDLFKGCGCSVQSSELFLVATHIQVYIDKEKGGIKE